MGTKSCYAIFFLLFFILNVLTPLSFGDDYVYSFVWEGHSIYEPLSENAIRVSSLKDLYNSQVLHYFTWSGRIVSHTLAQLFLWTDKSVFDIFNAFISILLVAEIYWSSHKGMITLKADSRMLCGIFFAVWTFTPGFGDVFLWLDGACNYLWTTVILIGFLLPYIRKYYSFSTGIQGKKLSIFMFFYGIVAGCTNENTICWVLSILVCFIVRLWKSGKTEQWLYSGVVGLFIGYVLLLFSPGNMERLLAEHNGYDWFTWSGFGVKVALLVLLLFYFQSFLWVLVLRSMHKLRGKVNDNKGLDQEMMLVKIMCAASFCMSFMMLFSPNFLPRSAFPGTVFLIIAACILLRILDAYEVSLIGKKTKNFICVGGVIVFFITAIATAYGTYYYYEQIQRIISSVKLSEYARTNTLVVKSIRPVHDIIAKASYFHLNYYKMSDEENDWRNVAFSRYYGIKGIRMVK